MEARHSRHEREKRAPGQETSFAGVPLAQARITASVDSPNAPFGIPPLGVGTPLSNGTSQHSAASDLHTQGQEAARDRDKIFTVDDPDDPSTPAACRQPLPFARGAAPSTHKDDLSVPSGTHADPLGVAQRANSSSSRFPHAGFLKRAASHEPSTNRRASDTLEMHEFAPK